MIQNKQPDCFLCGHSMQAELDGLADTRFGIEGLYCISACHHCGLFQTIPIPDSEELKQLYENYYNFEGEKGTIYTRIRDGFLASVAYRLWLAIDGDISFYLRHGHGRLLDVGCNEGRGMSIYHHNGFDPEGLEINDKAAQIARLAGFTVYTQTLDDEFHPEEAFDVVVLSNVLEHAINPKNMLDNIHRILKPDGHLWISCPNIHSWQLRLFGCFWINWHVPFHLFHFSSKTIRELLKLSNFKITRIKYATPSHWMALSVISAIFFKRSYQTSNLRSPFLVAFLMIFFRLFLFPITWIGNLTGHGDCLIVNAQKL